MKNILLHWMTSLAMLLFSVPSFAQFSVGVSGGYGSGVRESTLQLRSAYQINNKWSLNADGNYYLSDLKQLYFYEANLNVHYVFIDHRFIYPYALTGLNIYFETLEGVDTFMESGINVGGGMRVGLFKWLSLYGELRYVISDANQFFTGGGVLVHF